MTGGFGGVATMYDDVRPGYPVEVLEAIVAFGGTPASVVELGAGTGKGTELLVRLGVPVTCVEPDPRMAAVLQSKFPQVTVANQTFEEWQPPIKADLIACALAWHWLDPATRNQRCRAALTNHGTLAVYGHTYGYADPAVEQAVTAVLTTIDPTVRPRAEHWVRDDATSSGVWNDVEEYEWHTFPELAKEQYLQLMQTFGPFLRRTPNEREQVLTGLERKLPERLTLDLRTTLVLARG